MKSIKEICEETIGGEMHGGKLAEARNKMYLLMISATLIRERGDLNKTAAALAITRDGLRYQIKILGIDVEKTITDNFSEAGRLAEKIAAAKKPMAAAIVVSPKIRHG